MPYSKIEELPDPVKNSLPADAQSVWMGAFNSAFEKDKDEKKCSAAAWSAVENAGWSKNGDKWEKKQHSSQSTGELEAEVFAVGKWNNDEYTIEDLQDMVRNFDLLRDEIKPPVKLGHSDEGINKIVVDKGQPAYGWVKSLKVVGNKLVAAFTGIPDILMRAVKAGRYKRVSSEIYWNMKKGDSVFKRVLGAVAFLGADAPAVTNLADLEALLTQSTDAAIASGSFERKAFYSFQSDDSEHIKTEERRETMPDEAKRLADLEAENMRLRASLDTVTASTLELKKMTAANNAREYCERQVKAGLMLPSVRDMIMKGIKEGKYEYSEKSGYVLPFGEFQNLYDVKGKGGSTKVEFGQRGDAREEETDESDDAEESREDFEEGQAQRDPRMEVDRQTRKYMAKHNVADYGTAMKAVLKMSPGLARKYVNATPIVKHEGVELSNAPDVDEEG